MTPTRIRVLIADDDVLARKRLRAVADETPALVVVAECGDGREAADALLSTEVDLVFLDVEMPRLDGFGVLAHVGADRMPPVIFTSAYSEFAVRAFEAYAVDYLLKPFDDARFAAAVDRVRRQMDARRGETAATGAALVAGDLRLAALLEHLKLPVPTSYPDGLAIRCGAQFVVIRVADVDWIEADGNYSQVYVQQRPRLLTKTLATLEKEVLDPAVFLRVHRSAIVNTRKIVAVEPHVHGDMTLVLRDGTRVQCSRRFRKHLDEKLYFTS